MTLTGLVVLLIVAGVCGSLGSAIAGHSHVGCLGSIVLGFVGAWIGTWIARAFRLPHMLIWHVGGEAFPVVWSIVGAAVFVAVLGLLTYRRSW